MQLSVPDMDSLELSGKRVLVRVDFNVPFGEGGVISDDTRIRAALPTIREVLAKGGSPVLLSHLGRPKGQVNEGLRLDPVAGRLSDLLELPVIKLDESCGADVKAAIEAGATDAVFLLENVRFHSGETEGDPELSAAFAKLGDCFIGDAFGAAHRDHCSVSGVARLLPSAAGRLLQKEIDAFGRVLNDPARPLVAILGGAKVSDKLTVIDNLLDRVQALMVGGGMAYTFLKALGHEVGGSLVQEDQLDSVRASIEKAKELGVQLLLPSDHVVAREFSAETETRTVGVDVPEGWMALDIGPETTAAYVECVASARTLVWNGPMGVFEMLPFQAGTRSVAEAVAACPGYTVVGGGDSVAAIGLFGLGAEVDHISTGGGASLELLEGRTLPGIAALGSN